MIRRIKDDNSLNSSKFGPIWSWAIPLLALLMKILIIINIPQHIFPGSDAESYVDGANSLIESGIFSKSDKLLYFPAGYPIVIFICSKISIVNSLFILSLFQSIIFAFATWYIINLLNFGKLTRYLPWISFLISFNPTLTLSSLVLGYESLVASSLMIANFTLLSIKKENPRNWYSILVFSLFSAFASFLQPRFIATSIFLLFFFVIKEFGFRKSSKFISLPLIMILLSPLFLGFRNYESNDKFVVSNNLGSTMLVGAGPNASGGYTDKVTDNICSEDDIDDKHLVLCVLKWYTQNPIQILRLSFNKTLYFFSPWSGPLATGTMLRNPWLKAIPAYDEFSYKNSKKIRILDLQTLLSWAWLIGTLGTLLIGFGYFVRRGAELKLVGLIAGISVGISWLISLVTIGDHRFRLPVMSFILLLQFAGLKELVKKALTLKFKAKKR